MLHLKTFCYTVVHDFELLIKKRFMYEFLPKPAYLIGEHFMPEQVVY